jgi:hypothetical protein
MPAPFERPAAAIVIRVRPNDTLWNGLCRPSLSFNQQSHPRKLFAEGGAQCH